MPLYDAVKDLTLTIERVELEPHVLPLKHLTRRTTVFHLHGSGEEGVGEDVTYEEAHHQDVELPDLTGEHTVDSFSKLVADEPGYRIWGLESAALDLALRQAGSSLAAAVGREPRPVTFVVSQSTVKELLAIYPGDPLQARRERQMDGRGRRGARLRPAPSTSSTSRACTTATGSKRRRRQSSTAASRRRSRRPGSRTRASTTRRAPRSSRTTTGSPGTSRSTRSTTSRRSNGRRAASTRSRRASGACSGSSTSTTTARRTGSRSTAAASSSSGPAAARSSTSRRSSIPAMPNDVAPEGVQRGRPEAGPAAEPAAGRLADQASASSRAPTSACRCRPARATAAWRCRARRARARSSRPSQRRAPRRC